MPHFLSLSKCKYMSALATLSCVGCNNIYCEIFIDTVYYLLSCNALLSLSLGCVPRRCHRAAAAACTRKRERERVNCCSSQFRRTHTPHFYDHHATKPFYVISSFAVTADRVRQQSLMSFESIGERTCRVTMTWCTFGWMCGAPRVRARRRSFAIWAVLKSTIKLRPSSEYRAISTYEIFFLLSLLL
jgi:hypothetical protein